MMIKVLRKPSKFHKMLFGKQMHVHNSRSQMQCIRHQTLKNDKEEKTDKSAKKKIKPNPLQSVKARDHQRSLLSKCNLQECLSCVYWIICLHVSFSVVSTTGVPVLMKHQVDIPLQGAKAWYVIFSKYTRVSTGKIDLLTVSLAVMVLDTLKKTLAFCILKERTTSMN